MQDMNWDNLSSLKYQRILLRLSIIGKSMARSYNNKGNFWFLSRSRCQLLPLSSFSTFLNIPRCQFLTPNSFPLNPLSVFKHGFENAAWFWQQECDASTFMMPRYRTLSYTLNRKRNPSLLQHYSILLTRRNKVTSGYEDTSELRLEHTL